MKNYLHSNIGRLRLLALLEGLSLVILVFIAVPLKYVFLNAVLVRWVGQIHGILFVLFLLNTFKIALEENWKFSHTTWKIILACFIPFGTFYIDKKILRKLHEKYKK